MIEVRRAKREDAKAAWEIRNAAILSQCAGHYTADELKMWTSGEFSEKFVDTVEKHFHVATLDGRVVGTGMIDLKTGKVDAIFVHPGHMRKGVGRKIIKFLEQLARDNGLDELNLESTLNAAPFYRSCGFEGKTVGKYESPRGASLNCIPMVKRLR